MTPKQSQPKQNQANEATQARREFLKKIGKGSATVPAAVLLLAAAGAKNAKAGGGSGSGSSSGSGSGSGTTSGGHRG